MDDATEIFDALEFLPAPGQGVIALECRADDDATRAALAAVDHAPTRAAVTAERAFLAALGSGCDLPVGAYGRVEGDRVLLRAMLGGEEPSEAPLFGDASGPLRDAATLGRELGERLLARRERGGPAT